MSKLQFHENKVLKLTNVLKYKVQLNDENLDVVIEQMKTYIQTNGFRQVGPLIQYMGTFCNDGNELAVEMYLMLQCSDFIDSVEQPYSMEAVVRIPDALYCRYTGPKAKMRFAYDKINLEAFEKDIVTANCNYTIFVNDNVEDDVMTADVFVPRREIL